MTAPAALIGVDWGTSSFRAVLLDASGALLDRRDGPHGIMAVKDGDFAGVLSREIGAGSARGAFRSSCPA
jgi:2-dehydro-3-deoxygalactonokinase